MKFAVRKAQLSDLDSIFAIEQAHGFNPRSLKQLLFSLEHHQVWVLANDQVIAFAVFQCVLDEAELLNIVLNKAFQGQGLAKQLLSQSLESLQQQGILQCLLEVGESNLTAQGLYRTLGFKEIAVRKNYYHLASGVQDALIFEYRF